MPAVLKDGKTIDDGTQTGVAIMSPWNQDAEKACHFWSLVFFDVEILK